jgi:hypothetical protein
VAAAPMIRFEDVRDKLEPMINGLFSKIEREIVLEAIAQNLVSRIQSLWWRRTEN